MPYGTRPIAGTRLGKRSPTERCARRAGATLRRPPRSPDTSPARWHRSLGAGLPIAGSAALRSFDSPHLAGIAPSRNGRGLCNKPGPARSGTCGVMSRRCTPISRLGSVHRCERVARHRGPASTRASLRIRQARLDPLHSHRRQAPPSAAPSPRPSISASGRQEVVNPPGSRLVAARHSSGRVLRAGISSVAPIVHHAASKNMAKKAIPRRIWPLKQRR